MTEHLHEGLHPGENCPTCSRRVPFPKTATSPKTRPMSYRVPLDEADAHTETIDTVAELLGVTGAKYHRFTAVSYCLAVVLQHGVRLETGE